MPIINNTLGFKIKRDLDSIILEKIGDRDLTVSLYYQETCKTFTILASNLVLEDFLNITIPKKDGIYKVRVTSTDTITEEFEYKDFLLSNFNFLIRSIVDDVEKYITNCADCTNCNDCNEIDNAKEAILLSKMLSFYILNRDYYESFFNNGLKCIECSILDSVNCITINQYIEGKNERSNLNKEIISYLYYIFYLAEKSIFSCCLEGIDKKFKINKIKKYLDKNININCIETAILSNPDYYMSDSNLIEL